MDKIRKVTFKEPGTAITIGGQRFDANNITPARYDALVGINPEYKKLFDVHEVEPDKSLSEEEGAKLQAKLAKASAKPTTE